MAASSAAAKGGKALMARALPRLQQQIMGVNHGFMAMPRWSSRLLRGQAALVRGVLQRGAPNARLSTAARANGASAPSAHYRVHAKYAMEAHPDKEHGSDGKPQGEDAQFIRADDSWLVCGIADGVGGWSAEGIDAGAYARALMQHAWEASSHADLRHDPRALLHHAHQSIDIGIQGSCTACIVVFEQERMRCVNLGDSGAIGVRQHQQQPFFRTSEQQHRFNCPYQLGSDGHGDLAARGDVLECSLQHNDIVVLGTDGFFDNLFDHEITGIVRDFVSQSERRNNWPQAAKHAAPSASTTLVPPPLPQQQTQQAGLHTSPTAANLAASLAAASVAPAAAAAAPTRAFSTAPANEAAGPVETLSLALRAPAMGDASSPRAGAAGFSASGGAAPRGVSLSDASLQELADELLKKALLKANDARSQTPFAEAARKARKRFNGGKLDDVTIVVAQLVIEDGQHDVQKRSASATAKL